MLGSGNEITVTDLPVRLAGDALLPLAENLSYRAGVNAARKELVLKALRKTDGNRAAAARLSGLENKYFLRLIKSLQI